MMTPSPYPGAQERPVRRTCGRSGRIGVVLAGVAVSAAAAVALAARSGLVRRIEVAGVSMLPELAPGDRLVVLRWPHLAVGDIVAFADPEDSARVLVKRVSRLHALSIEVAGDNEGASRDSRQFGPVSRRDVLGRVVGRYEPAAAARLFRRGTGAIP